LEKIILLLGLYEGEAASWTSLWYTQIAYAREGTRVTGDMTYYKVIASFKGVFGGFDAQKDAREQLKSLRQVSRAHGLLHTKHRNRGVNPASLSIWLVLTLNNCCKVRSRMVVLLYIYRVDICKPIHFPCASKLYFSLSSQLIPGGYSKSTRLLP
jgi:hypothetical protein